MYINKEAITRLHVVVWGNSLRLRVTGIYSDMNHISALLDDTHVNHDVPETSIPKRIERRSQRSSSFARQYVYVHITWPYPRFK